MALFSDGLNPEVIHFLREKSEELSSSLILKLYKQGSAIPLHPNLLLRLGQNAGANLLPLTAAECRKLQQHMVLQLDDFSINQDLPVLMRQESGGNPQDGRIRSEGRMSQRSRRRAIIMETTLSEDESGGKLRTPSGSSTEEGKPRTFSGSSTEEELSDDAMSTSKEAPNEDEVPSAEDFVPLGSSNCSRFSSIGCPKLLSFFDAHDGEVNTVQWGHNVLLSGGGDSLIKMWGIGYGTCAALKNTLNASGRNILSVDFSPQETDILGAYSDHTCRLWQVKEQSTKQRHILCGHADKVSAAKFLNGDHHKIISGSYDRTLKLWNLDHHGACTGTIETSSKCTDVLACFSSIVSSHFDGMVKLWDLRMSNDKPTGGYELPGKPVTSLHMSQDNNYILTCAKSKHCLVALDTRRGKMDGFFQSETFKVGSELCKAQFSPDAKHVVAGSKDGKVHIWNFNTGKQEFVLENCHRSTVVACAWNDTGIATCDRRGKVAVWLTTLI